MFDLERFLKEKLNPLYRLHYSLWVHWWPFWRRITGGNILKKWRKWNLVGHGKTVLDFGCGTGFFTMRAARMVTETGRVFALDYFPRQLEIVEQEAEKAGLTNIETILSDSHTGLPDESVDVVWMCDVLHEISSRRTVLEELHRVLKDDGFLAIYDSMREKTTHYTRDLFSVTDRDEKLYRFNKI